MTAGMGLRVYNKLAFRICENLPSPHRRCIPPPASHKLGIRAEVSEFLAVCLKLAEKLGELG